MLDWESQESHLILNPRMQGTDMFQGILQFDFPGHLWLCTSGSIELKLVGLSKEAFLISAQAVNTHLESNAHDVWLNPLPHFHVGGLGMMARAYLSNAKIVNYNNKWDVTEFHRQLIVCSCTLTALVPTQVFDLVKQQLQAPISLRGVVVGGGSLSKELMLHAKKLGWNLLPSYGMTECASQIATAKMNDSRLHLLPHVEVNSNEAGLLCLRSKSLLSAYGLINEGKLSIYDPKENGVFTTEDYGFVQDGKIELLGRGSDFIKIGGENVNLMRLSQILEEIKLKHEISYDTILVSMEDERLGQAIHLVTTAENSGEISSLISTFQESVMPFEKIRKIHYNTQIPRNPLGKVCRTELLHSLS